MGSPASFQPHRPDEVARFLQERSAAGAPVFVRGGGSKAGFGRPARDDETRLDLNAISGITLYEPDELVLTARAGTPIGEIAAAVAERKQCLAFEPPEFGALFGNDGLSTLGGAVASGWSGPRRVKVGAVRDHVLGALAVGGDGQVFKSGGRVVKNVTGFDLPKLLTGSHGTLAVMTEITIKVLPAPEATRTLVLFGLDDRAAVRLLCEILGMPYEVTGAAHLPQSVAARSAIPGIAKAGASATLIRLEGFGPSVADRFAGLEAKCGRATDHLALDVDDCAVVWREIRDAVPLIPAGPIVWRLSLVATDSAAVVAALARQAGAEAFYDWGGGLVWLTLPEGAADGHAALIRGLLPAGHATLMRAPADVRAGTSIFQPQEPALAALQKRVKAAFDPHLILGAGRMAAEA